MSNVFPLLYCISLFCYKLSIFTEVKAITFSPCLNICLQGVVRELLRCRDTLPITELMNSSTLARLYLFIVCEYMNVGRCEWLVCGGQTRVYGIYILLLPHWSWGLS